MLSKSKGLKQAINLFTRNQIFSRAFSEQRAPSAATNSLYAYDVVVVGGGHAGCEAAYGNLMINLTHNQLSN